MAEEQISEKAGRIFIIDLMPFLYRGHFAFMRKPRITASGINTSALVGLANGLLSILKDFAPTHVVLAMDPDGLTFRHETYPEYKAGRDKMPEDLAENIPRAFELAEALKIPVVRIPKFEADDVMGTIAAKASSAGFEVFLATPDKDVAQLVTENVKLFRPGHMPAPPEIYDAAKVCEHWGIPAPRQMVDFLSLAGDTSDNIPGVRGVGEKTAMLLLQEYGSLDGIFEHIAEIRGKVAEKIAASKETAILSKYLATIRTDIPLEPDWEEYRLKKPNVSALAKVCAKYELSQFAQKLGVTEDMANAEAEKYRTLADVPHNYSLVTTDAEAKALARILEASPRFAFDTETTGTDARTAELVGMSFATEKGKAWYVAMPRVGGMVAADDLFAQNAGPDNLAAAKKMVAHFAKAFADRKKVLIAQNAKFDRMVLGNLGIVFGSTIHDTMLEHYVLDAAARHGMDVLAREYLGYDPIPIERLIGEKERGKTQRNMAELAPEAICDYACEDADVTLQLEDVLRAKVREAGLERVLTESEEPLIPILEGMEREGVALDVKALRQYGISLDREIGQLVNAIREYAGPGVNIDSPKQLGELLFGKLQLDPSLAKKTSTGNYATDEKTLMKLVDYHPVVWDILQYRACTKLKTTYVDKLPQCIDPKDGRVHTTFAQAFTETGRLSSSDPNLQNIPVRSDRGKNIRAAIVPRDKNHVLVSADYSQIELRLMAAASGDESMLAAFARGDDIHRETAARVFNVAASEVTDEQRARCKMVNFGIIYGISAFGLSQRLHIARRDAADLIDTYFALYPKIRAYMTTAVEKAREKGYAETLLGRRRTLRDINSRNATARQAAERDAVNTPIQGTAADLVKLAMVRVDKALRKEGLAAKMILQIHDELLFDAPRGEASRVAEIAQREMSAALDVGVPLDVSTGIGKNWLEAH